MEIQRMVESIVRELLKQSAMEPVKLPKVLYVFGDSTAHEAFSDHFITLNNKGILHDNMFLDGVASAWLGRHRIESGGAGKAIAVDEFAPAPLELPLEYDGIVIPEIDLDSAGRITLGMKGTVTSELVFAALVLNKFVLVGDDIPGLNRADRRTLKTLSLPGPFKKLFDYYKQEMQMYGVEFGAMKDLAELAVRKCAAIRLVEGAESVMIQQAVPGNSATETVLFEGKLLSAEWVKLQIKSKAFTGVKLSKGAIVSPLAKDMLRERGIVVQYAEER